MRYSVFLLAVLLFATGVSHVRAQSLGAEPLTVDISPQYPEPYDTVTVTPQSTLFDLNASTVTISVNGKVIQNGSGSRSATFTAGTAGGTDTIVVSAASPSGTYKKTIAIHPASVALVLEPISTTHPFYGGGSLVASEGRVRLIALPELRTGAGLLSPANLVYTWKAGDQILLQQSGLGRSVLTAIAPIRYRDTTISVTVSTPDNSVVTQASVDLSPVDPLLVIYRNSPLFGPDFDSALSSSFAMSGNEETFRAVPYFFSGTQNLAWSVNGNESGTDPVITVRTTGDAPGTALLSVTASQPGSYQSAEDSLTVGFGQNQSSTNIFGL